MTGADIFHGIMDGFFCYFIGMTIISTVWQLPSFNDYARIYKMLPNLKFFKDKRSAWAILPGEKLDVFIWNFKLNSFCLGKNSVLVNSVVTCFCPYSFYWLIKYQRWFKKNINISELKEFEDR